MLAHTWYINNPVTRFRMTTENEVVENNETFFGINVVPYGGREIFYICDLKLNVISRHKGVRTIHEI